MSTAPWLVVAAASMMTASLVAQRPPEEPAGGVRQLHRTTIEPASQAVFDVGREAPGNGEEWGAISNAGLALVTAGTRLRRAAPDKNRAGWVRLSAQLVSAGRAVLTAAEARNVEKLTETSDRLIVVCETCHARYRKPGARP